ncbi:hypothetical protein RHOFW510R12_01375 [Rhodanobacter sp. FW510-R12]|uniref:hypothetical protein n=1 Tax=unclassified Rhodanobacter TaxID=2621553 RepID=UPI0007A9E152|nr:MULTISPECIES: hypothetical protein [unclassified Rhodanobacter]KZC17045.1 hypothetical protein RHOFW104R8_13470 [Rhodanobacter sp. FW104-R8]KZC28569.1 hypothetical protein RhoFW510T8_10710 [Rhodanobacter sp. FW510-T8]KZC32329.1 hypothetical protein RhoFW510R10_12920 [Rhodanobacter sp. FW510-R10]
MTRPVDVLAVIRAQEARKAALRFFPLAPRKQRKTIKQADVDAAVSKKLDELDREFRRLGLEFPKFAQAYDTARVVVKNARSKA